MTRMSVMVIMTAAFSISHAPSARAAVVFNYTAEYAAEPTPAAIGTDAANLNGSIDQVGLFSGTLPMGAGGEFPPDLVGFADHPDVPGRVLWVDRPVASGSFFAELAQPVDVGNAVVSLHVGTRRTQNGNRVKDYDIIGLDGAGMESFRLTVNTENGVERLGVKHSGGAESFNLINDFGGIGQDNDQDLDNLGGVPFDANEIGFTTLRLGLNSYTIDFTNGDGSRSFTTGLVPYNGSATELSRLEFTFAGHASANSDRSGYILDNILVDGVPPGEFVLGDVNGDLFVDIADYRIIRDLFLTSGNDAADLDRNGSIGFGDFQIWRNAFHAAQMPASVPEPTSATLLLLAGATLFVRRRRPRP